MTTSRESREPLPSPRRGRPRSSEANEAILVATYEILAEHGFAGLNIEAVAARAGVSKNTVYRRCANVEELVVEFVRTRTATRLPIEQSGDIRANLASLIRYYLHVVTTSPLSAVLPALIDQMTRSPKLASVLHKWFQDERRQLSRDILKRAIASGEVRPDTDLDAVLDAAFGLVFQQAIVHGLGTEMTSPEEMADLLIDGIGTAVR
jgi:AcrR family transcriptional regulator